MENTTYEKDTTMHRQRLTAKQAVEIYNDLRPQADVARDYKVLESLVSRIRSRKIWAKETAALPTHTYPLGVYKLTADQIDRVVTDKRGHNVLAREMGVSASCIFNHRKKHGWQKLSTDGDLRTMNPGRPRKLTDSQLVAIVLDKRMAPAISSLYGVSTATIKNIRRKIGVREINAG